MSGYLRLDTLDLLLASVLVLANGGLSLALRLGLERQLLVATVRMTVQLALMGLVLRVLLTTVSPWLTAGAAMAMVLFAGREIVARQGRRFGGPWSYGLGVTSMALAATLVTLFALTTQIQPEPWYHPRYALPLLGMVLGNTMTGIALGLDTLTATVSREQRAVEARLCMGHPRMRALRGPARDALRTALMPTINAMAATGLVALPGMMTGQILAGTPPAIAVKYQILIMFVIAVGTGFGTLAAVSAGARRLFDARERLRIDRLTDASG